MAEGKRRGLKAAIRGVVLLLVAAGIGIVIWRVATRREDYVGGNIRTTGTIEAVHVDLGFQVAGRLADVPVAEGEVLKPGQLVGTLDPQDFQVQARTAQAAVEAAQAAKAQAQAALGVATANRTKADGDLERMRSLMAQSATTPQQMDDATAAAQVAAAQVEAAKAQAQAAEAQIAQTESALAQANLQLSYTELRAPEGGVVAEKIHRPGEMVTPNTPVVSLAEMDTVKVLAAVDETRIGAVREGDRVQVRVYTFDRKSFDGVVTQIQPAGDFATRKDWGAQRRDIRTFTVTAEMPNPGHLLKNGMTAEVTIDVSATVKTMVGAKP